MTNTNAIPNAFFLSLLAGLGTGMGGLMAVISRPGKQWFGFLMGTTCSYGQDFLGYDTLMDECL